MNEYQIVSLISLLGFLILVTGAFRSHRVNVKKGFYMAAAWAGPNSHMQPFQTHAAQLLIFLSRTDYLRHENCGPGYCIFRDFIIAW